MAGLSSQEGVMPLEPLPASREPGLVLRDEDRTLLSTLASDLRRHWQRARSSHFEAAEMVDLRMFVRGLADTCAQAAGFALAGQAQALDTALREAGWSGKRPDPARAQALGERVEALAAALSQSASTGRTPESASMTVAASAPASAPRVFLVDSEPAQAKFLSLQLAAQGYAAESFVDWDALVHAMASRQPAALIADIDAPHGVFGGADQVSELRRAGKLLCPVLFLSARADSRTKLIALRAGGVGSFVKPVAAPEL
ncbi:MAG: response regulator transcription factor, partial [Lysobacterales bacterium]